LAVKKTAENKLRALFAKHQFPAVDVVIPVLERSGRGEEELFRQFYETEVSLTRGIMQILGLRTKDMKTLVKAMEVVFSWEGQKFEPIELSESKFSYAVPDCPMVHVGKNITSEVKSKFCDLFCTAASQAMMDTVLGKGKGSCRWDKSLIHGGDRCRLLWEITESE
jgi:hypothetical protein